MTKDTPRTCRTIIDDIHYKKEYEVIIAYPDEYNVLAENFSIAIKEVKNPKNNAVMVIPLELFDEVKKRINEVKTF